MRVVDLTQAHGCWFGTSYVLRPMLFAAGLNPALLREPGSVITQRFL